MDSKMFQITKIQTFHLNNKWVRAIKFLNENKIAFMYNMIENFKLIIEIYNAYTFEIEKTIQPLITKCTEIFELENGKLITGNDKICIWDLSDLSNPIVLDTIQKISSFRVIPNNEIIISHYNNEIAIYSAVAPYNKIYSFGQRKESYIHIEYLPSTNYFLSEQTNDYLSFEYSFYDFKSKQELTRMKYNRIIHVRLIPDEKLLIQSIKGFILFNFHTFNFEKEYKYELDPKVCSLKDLSFTFESTNIIQEINQYPEEGISAFVLDSFEKYKIIVIHLNQDKKCFIHSIKNKIIIKEGENISFYQINDKLVFPSYNIKEN